MSGDLRAPRVMLVDVLTVLMCQLTSPSAPNARIVTLYRNLRALPVVCATERHRTDSKTRIESGNCAIFETSPHALRAVRRRNRSAPRNAQRFCLSVCKKCAKSAVRGSGKALAFK
jgi:hypothetical protein